MKHVHVTNMQKKVQNWEGGKYFFHSTISTSPH